jgi:hypothetical protein
MPKGRRLRGVEVAGGRAGKAVGRRLIYGSGRKPTCTRNFILIKWTLVMAIEIRRFDTGWTPYNNQDRRHVAGRRILRAKPAMSDQATDELRRHLNRVIQIFQPYTCSPDRLGMEDRRSTSCRKTALKGRLECSLHKSKGSPRGSRVRSQPPPMRNMRVATNHATRAAATAATATAAALANVGSKSLSTVTTPKHSLQVIR